MISSAAPRNGESVRVGIVGTGFGARVHLPVLRGMEGVEVVGLAGHDLKRTKSVAASQGCPELATTVDELIERDDVDALTLALPPSQQVSIAQRAFRGGKHVLCEKPLAPSVAEAEAIVDAWRASGRVGGVDFGFRYIPEIASFLDLLARGSCGRVTAIEAKWLLPTRLNPGLTDHWKGQKDQGGGVLRNFGSHLLEYLFDDLPAVEVLGAAQSTIFATRPDTEGRSVPVQGDEVTVALLRYHGMPVDLQLSLVDRFPIGHRVLVRGTEGELELVNPYPNGHAGPFSLRRRSPDGVWKTVSIGDSGDPQQLFRRVAGMFVGRIRGLAGAFPGLDRGVEVCRLTDAIESLAAGQGAREPWTGPGGQSAYATGGA